MTSPPPPSRKRDRFLQLFGEKARPLSSTTPLPARLHNSTAIGAHNAHVNSSTTPVLQHPFKRNKIFEKDIAILSTTYILEQHPDLRRLIRLIVKTRHDVEDDELVGVLETCSKFSLQLASALNGPHHTEAVQAIAEFTKTVEKMVSECTLGGGCSNNELKDMVDNAISEINSSQPSLSSNHFIRGREELKGLDAIIGGSVTILDIVSGASDAIPVSMVKPAVGAVVSLLKAIDQTRTNFSLMKQITTIAGEFVVSLAVLCSTRDTQQSQKLERAVNKFTNTLEGIAEECKDLSKLNPCWRFLQQGVHKNDLDQIKVKLNAAIELFQTEGQVRIQMDVEELAQKIDRVVLNSLPSHPPYEPNDYFAGSREDAIEHISNHIGESNDPVFWVHGAAGLGKSTMAQQLGRLLRSDERLGGSVFLTNMATERPSTVVQMISKQLGERHPQAIPHIIQGADKLDSAHSPLRDYILSHIINPIRALQYPYQLVVIIDGLDEWTNHEAFLRELEHIPSPSPVKFVLTSRFNHSIERLLTRIVPQPYLLPPVPKTVVESYFKFHFEKIEWRGRKPDELTIGLLADQSQGLLIWAATVCSVVSYEFDERSPWEILDQILSSEQKVGAQADQQLERLYRAAISNLFPKAEEVERFAQFFGAMLVLQEPLSIHEFARISGIGNRPAEEVQRRLVALQTHNTAPTNVVTPATQLFHLSFLEFMQSLLAEDSHRWAPINTADAHSVLAKKCVGIVFSEILSPHNAWRSASVNQVSLRPVELYAVKFWPLHFSSATPPPPSFLSDTELGRMVVDISKEGMHQWATLFLPNIISGHDDELDFLEMVADPQEILIRLATIIKDDSNALLYHMHCLEVGVRLSPDDVEAWDGLGHAYDRLYEDGRQSKYLDEEIRAFRQAMERISDDRSMEDRIMEYLALALRSRWSQKGTLDDLDEAISFHQKALALRSIYHLDRSQSVNNLALALESRFSQKGMLTDLDNAISLHREAIVLRPPPHPDRTSSLNNLAVVFYTRFDKRGTPNDLDEAISLYREVLALRPESDPDRLQPLNNLAIALGSRFSNHGVLGDLDDAISLHREALVLCCSPHPDRSASLCNLGVALHTRFQKRGLSADLDEAISLHREALVLRPLPHPHRSQALGTLGIALRTRFTQRGMPNDLDEAVSLHQEALVLRPVPHPGRSQALTNLASTLDIRFELRHMQSDLGEAILLHQEALSLCPAPNPVRSISLNNLATALWARFSSQRISDDLDRAISLHREALDLFPAPHPHRSISLNNLALALRARFEQQRMLSDLDEAISLHREALVLRPVPHPDRPSSLYNFSIALRNHFNHKENLDVLDEAISLLREAIVLWLSHHPRYPLALVNLAYNLWIRFHHTHLANDIDDIISLYRQLLDLPITGAPRAWASKQLPLCLRARFELTGDQKDADEAIRLETDEQNS